MHSAVVRRALGTVLFACLVAVGAAAPDLPPKNLKPLLVPHASEMRLVTARYTMDRATLGGNFLGGGRAGMMRNPAAAAPVVEPLSPNRIARLKRFDLDWQAALSGLDVSRLSPAARTELETLKAGVAANLAQLEAETATLSALSPLVPFAPAIVRLVESRIRLEEFDPQQAAGTLTDITRQVNAVRASVEAGKASVSKDIAQRLPGAVDTLRAALAEWFTFYNGYDPLFTWWNGLPYKKADAALIAYVAVLKEKAPLLAEKSSGAPQGAALTIAPAPAPRFPSVPDLAEILSLSQDEMSDIVLRFRGQPAASGRNAGETAPVAAPGGARTERSTASNSSAPPVRDKAYSQAWLKALRSLDFDRLSRNAQVDYLYIRKMAELQIARDGQVLPENPPRKADATGIPGKARGRQGLINDLQDELIPYTPEELIALAEKEFAWCEEEMRKASRQLGLGDDWKRALEAMKQIHPPPGGQVKVIRELMYEAVDYLRDRDLLTVPSVAAESLHMIMMTPERQLVNPFFTGGSQISVSYPTDTMDYEARLQSMRGNNTPFSHATAFHEMIPGHNLVFYMNSRFRGYRAPLAGNSPFYGEGWPLYWELMMYEKGFHDTPQKKIGALFWRMHRCARIIFSLKFHMGDWSPAECIDFLVERVGFERDNATGEVRRSFQGGYGPLYQAAYLLGGLQMRAMRREIVEGGVMTEKAFHDEVLRQGSMPVTMLRLVLNRQKLTRDMPVEWRFYDAK